MLKFNNKFVRKTQSKFLLQISGSEILSNGGSTYLWAIGGTTAAAFFYHLVISRLIGPSNYGLFGSMLSMQTLLVVPIGALQVAVTQATRRQSEQGEVHTLRPLLLNTFLVSITFSLVSSVFASQIDKFLHTTSPIPYFLVLLWIPITTIIAVMQGSLIGMFKFRQVGIAIFVGSGLLRLVVGSFFVLFGFGVTGAIGAAIVSQLFTLILLVIYLKPTKTLNKSDKKISMHFRDSFLSMFGYIGCAVFIGIDTFFSRHQLSAIGSGMYSAVATAAHTVYLIPMTLGNIVFPYITENGHQSVEGRRIVRELLVLSMLLGALMSILFLIFPDFFMSVFFGSQYHGRSSIFRILTFESFFIGLSSVFFVITLARKSLLALIQWVPVFFVAITLSLWGHTMLSISLCMTTFSFLSFIIYGVVNFKFLYSQSDA